MASIFRSDGGIITTTVDTQTATFLSLGTGFANNVGIGQTSIGTTTVNNALTATGLTTANGGLTMGSTKNITLQPTAGYVAPTADTMLGGITTGTFLTPGSSFSASKDIANISLVKGTFLISYTFNANYTAIPTLDTYVLFTAGTALPIPSNFSGGTRLTAGAFGYSLSFPISITTAGTLIIRFVLTGGTIDNLSQTSFIAMRIA